MSPIVYIPVVNEESSILLQIKSRPLQSETVVMAGQNDKIDASLYYLIHAGLYDAGWVARQALKSWKPAIEYKLDKSKKIELLFESESEQAFCNASGASGQLALVLAYLFSSEKFCRMLVATGRVKEVNGIVYVLPIEKLAEKLDLIVNNKSKNTQPDQSIIFFIPRGNVEEYEQYRLLPDKTTSLVGVEVVPVDTLDEVIKYLIEQHVVQAKTDFSLKWLVVLPVVLILLLLYKSFDYKEPDLPVLNQSSYETVTQNALKSIANTLGSAHIEYGLSTDQKLDLLQAQALNEQLQTPNFLNLAFRQDQAKIQALVDRLKTNVLSFDDAELRKLINLFEAGEFVKARRVLIKASSHNIDHNAFYKLKKMLLFRLALIARDYRTAVNDFNDAIGIESFTHYVLPDDYFEYAYINLAAENHHAVIDKLSKYSDNKLLKPADWHTVQHLLAKAYMGLGQYNTALDLLNNALQKNEKFLISEHNLLLAEILLIKQDYAEVEINLSKAHTHTKDECLFSRIDAVRGDLAVAKDADYMRASNHYLSAGKQYYEAVNDFGYLLSKNTHSACSFSEKVLLDFKNKDALSKQQKIVKIAEYANSPVQGQILKTDNYRKNVSQSGDKPNFTNINPQESEVYLNTTQLYEEVLKDIQYKVPLDTVSAETASLPLYPDLYIKANQGLGDNYQAFSKCQLAIEPYTRALAVAKKWYTKDHDIINQLKFKLQAAKTCAPRGG